MDFSLWKRLWTCHKTDCRMNERTIERMNEWMKMYLELWLLTLNWLHRGNLRYDFWWRYEISKLSRPCPQKFWAHSWSYPVTDIKEIWCDFDRASSLICGTKMPTRCNRGFYCRSYCLLNMFRAPLCPSSGAQEYYTVVAACGISCCGFQVANRTHNPQLHTRPATWKPQHEIPQAATTV